LTLVDVFSCPEDLESRLDNRGLLSFLDEPALQFAPSFPQAPMIGTRIPASAAGATVLEFARAHGTA